MTKVVRREIRKRGFLGWVFLILFLGFNALMLWALLAGLAGVGETTASLETEAERAGAAIGATLGAGVLMVVWACGAVILGLLAILTRGSKTVVEETIN
jgi:hypothetical protein